MAQHHFTQDIESMTRFCHLQCTSACSGKLTWPCDAPADFSPACTEVKQGLANCTHTGEKLLQPLTRQEYQNLPHLIQTASIGARECCHIQSLVIYTIKVAVCQHQHRLGIHGAALTARCYIGALPGEYIAVVKVSCMATWIAMHDA